MVPLKLILRDNSPSLARPVVWRVTGGGHVSMQEQRQRMTLHGARAMRAAAGLIAAVLGPHAVAAQPGTAPWVPVDSVTLSQTRGGFVGASGLQVSLGIERLVTLNGNIVSRVHVDIPDIGNLGIQQARDAEQALSAINLVRNGPENMAVAPPASSLPGATLIQNSLNGQQIDSRTVINSSVNTLGMLTSLNFQGSLGDAIARSARPL